MVVYVQNGLPCNRGGQLANRKGPAGLPRDYEAFCARARQLLPTSSGYVGCQRACSARLNLGAGCLLVRRQQWRVLVDGPGCHFSACWAVLIATKKRNIIFTRKIKKWISFALFYSSPWNYSLAYRLPLPLRLLPFCWRWLSPCAGWGRSLSEGGCA